jgi:hypothetical protein
MGGYSLFILFSIAAAYLFWKYELFDASSQKWRKASEPGVKHAYAAFHILMIIASIALFFHAPQKP